MAEKCKAFKRRLTPFEINEIRLVFGDKLDYARVWIHECNNFPNIVDNIGRKLARRTPRDPKSNNALTLGNHIYFPIKFPEERTQGSWLECWLMHEVTHVWQFQQMGWKYLYMAIRAQMKLGNLAYHFGGEPELKSRRKSGKIFKDFNLEQQGDIVKDYYKLLSKGKDVSAFEPYIEDIQKG